MATSESTAVFKSATDRLGAFLSDRGFKYSKSKREATRPGKWFEYSVFFRTYRSVTSPDHIEFDVGATAWSEEYGEFRRLKGMKLDEEACLFCCLIENISKPEPPYIRYEIGNPSTRNAILESIEAVLSDQVMPFFDLLESPEQLRAYLATHETPGFDVDNAREDYFEFVSRTK